MQDKQFDEFFRNKIRGYRSPVSAAMWEKVKPAGRKKKRRVIFWLWFLLGGLALSGGTYLFYQEDTDSNTIPSTHEEKIVAKKTNPSYNHKEQEPPAAILSPTDSSAKYITDHTHKPLHLKPRNYDASKTNIHATPNKEKENIVASAVEDTFEESQSPAEPASDSIENNFHPTQDSAVAKKHKDSKPLNSKWFAELYAGPAIGIKSVEKEWLYPFLADGNSTSNLSYSSGIYIGKYIGKHFLLKTGLTYTSINEKPFHDSSAASTKDSRYTSWDIPVIAGYSTGKGKFKFNLNAGLIVNIHTSYKGTIADSVRIDDINSSGYFKKYTGIKGYAGISVLYTLSEKIQVYGEPYFIYQFSDMSARRTYFSQKTHVAGIAAGIRYSIPSRQRH